MAGLPKCNETVRRLNPNVFNAVGAVAPRVTKPNEGGEVKNRALEGSEERCGFRIQLIQLRRRLLDEHDNLRAAAKPAVDRITERLGFKADNDDAIEWHYFQIKTKGKEGLIVTIEQL